MDALPEQYSQDYFKSLIKSGSESEISKFLELRSERTFSEDDDASSYYGTYKQWCEIDNIIFRRKSERLKFELAKYCADIEVAKKIFSKKDKEFNQFIYKNKVLAEHNDFSEIFIGDTFTFIDNEINNNEYSPRDSNLYSLFLNPGFPFFRIDEFFKEELFIKFSYQQQASLIAMLRHRLSALNEYEHYFFSDERYMFQLPRFLVVNEDSERILARLFLPFYEDSQNNTMSTIQAYSKDYFQDRDELIDRWKDVYPEDKIGLIFCFIRDGGPVYKGTKEYKKLIKHPNEIVWLASLSVLELEIKDAKRILKKPGWSLWGFLLRNPFLWQESRQLYKLAMRFRFEDGFREFARMHGIKDDNPNIYSQHFENFLFKKLPFQMDLKLWHLIAIVAVIYLFKNL